MEVVGLLSFVLGYRVPFLFEKRTELYERYYSGAS
jgi:hypothetical protein